ncbi:MAG: FliA/WhiG family RNA polymerase sigma factor [Oscillospiraceae bacterium]
MEDIQVLSEQDEQEILENESVLKDEDLSEEIETAAENPKTKELHLRLDKYCETRDIALRNELVMDFGYIPKAVAAQMRGITSSYAQLEDIVNQGYLTLIDCLEKYDPTRGMKFESYAFMRVKGANIDFVRKQDWLPRRVRKTSRDLNAAYDELAGSLMREPTTKELADHIGEDEAFVNKHYREMSNSVLLSFEMLLQSATSEDPSDDASDTEDKMPEASLMRKELRRCLADAIDALSERERLVVSLSYYEHLKLAEIAEILKVSEARVCQTRAKAVLRMRTKLEAYMKG